MTYRSYVAAGLALALAGGTVAFLDAQGKGKPKPPPPAGTAVFNCGLDCGINASGPLDAILNGNGEMQVSDVAAFIVLDFGGQRPEGSPDLADCSAVDGTCLWNWSQDPRLGDFIDFDFQNNTLDPTGSSELGNGLLDMTADETVYKARFNMTITVPETEGFWRFDYNPNIPPDGGADLADVERVDACTWEFRATSGQRAALSKIVKPPKGKSYVHHEGTFAMPFVLTFNVPSLCPASD